MLRLSADLRKNIRREIENGSSIKIISNTYNVGKPTIYYYYKKIKGKLFKGPNVTPQYFELEGEIVGIFTGDGSQYFEPKRYHYEVNVHFGVHRREYALYVKALFEKFFKKNFRLTQETTKLRLRTHSKEIFHYFRGYIDYNPKVKHSTVRLMNLSIPNEFKLGFLRGLVDTDGRVALTKNSKRIEVFYYTTSKSLAEQTMAILKENKVECSCRTSLIIGRKPLYVTKIHKEGIDRFLKEVKPFKLRMIGPVV